MKNTGALTLQDLVDQGYTPTQIVNLIAGIQEAEEKRQAELKAKEEAQRKASVETAKKTLIASWFAYCDTVGVGSSKPEDMKFRNDLINLAITSADVAGNPSEENVETFLTSLLAISNIR